LCCLLGRSEQRLGAFFCLLDLSLKLSRRSRVRCSKISNRLSVSFLLRFSLRGPVCLLLDEGCLGALTVLFLVGKRVLKLLDDTVEVRLHLDSLVQLALAHLHNKLTRYVAVLRLLQLFG